MQLREVWKSTGNNSPPKPRKKSGTFRDVSFQGVHPIFVDDIDDWCIRNGKPRSFVMEHAPLAIWADLDDPCFGSRSDILDEALGIAAKREKEASLSEEQSDWIRKQINHNRCANASRMRVHKAVWDRLQSTGRENESPFDPV